MAGNVWHFRCALSVDMLAAAWLVERFAGGDARVRFMRSKPPDDAGGERLCFDQRDWREAGAATRFDAVLARLGLDDPALMKLAAVVRDADQRGESPSPMAIALTTLVQGWNLLPAPEAGDDPAEARARRALQFATPVFDSLHATFSNLLSGPSH